MDNTGSEAGTSLGNDELFRPEVIVAACRAVMRTVSESKRVYTATELGELLVTAARALNAVELPEVAGTSESETIGSEPVAELRQDKPPVWTPALIGEDEKEQPVEDRPPLKKQRDPRLGPAVPIEESVRPSYLVCLEDGQHKRMLKRYLRNTYGLSPAQYREKWGLPPDYPMVAPRLSQFRSEQRAKANKSFRRSADKGPRPPAKGLDRQP